MKVSLFGIFFALFFACHSQAGVAELLPVPKSFFCGSVLAAVAGYRMSDAHRDVALLKLKLLRKKLVGWNSELPSMKAVRAFGAENISKQRFNITRRITGIQNFSEAFPEHQNEGPFRMYGAVFEGEEEIQKFARDVRVSFERLDEIAWSYFSKMTHGGTSFIFDVARLMVIPTTIAIAEISGLPHRDLVAADTIAGFLGLGFVFGNLEQIYRTPMIYDVDYQHILKILEDPDRLRNSSFYVGKNVQFIKRRMQTSNAESLGLSPDEIRDLNDQVTFGSFSFAGLMFNREREAGKRLPSAPVFLDITLWQEEGKPVLTVFVREADTTPRFSAAQQGLRSLIPAFVRPTPENIGLKNSFESPRIESTSFKR